MGKYKDLVEDHLNARINKVKLASNVLGVLRGEVETTLKNGATDEDAVVEAAAKKMVKGLETVGGEEAQVEIELLEVYLPKTLSQGDILKELQKADIGQYPNFGARMGAAMKHLQGRADGNDVKEVVLKYYK